MARDRIFSAAKTVLEQDGLSGLSIRKVAAQSGMSPMAIYRHFADKDALINALTSEGFRAWEARIRAIDVEEPMAWLDALAEAYLAFALAEPHLFDAAFFLPASEARQYPDDFVAGHSPAIAMITLRIDQAKTDGSLGGTPAQEIALSLSALGQGMVSMQRANRFSSDEQFKSFFRATLRHCLASFEAKPAGELK